MMPKPEQANLWSSQEAAIKAEITEAKNTVDLIRMAQAIARTRRAAFGNGSSVYRVVATLPLVRNRRRGPVGVARRIVANIAPLCT